jgi:hypothetical protein
LMSRSPARSSPAVMVRQAVSWYTLLCTICAIVLKYTGQLTVFLGEDGR